MSAKPLEPTHSSQPFLADVYKTKGSIETLYRLLLEREPHVSISHRRMPTLAQHRQFVKSRPYRAWYLILVKAPEKGKANSKAKMKSKAKMEAVGGTYLSKSGEIGIFIFKAWRGCGYGEAAIRMLMERHASTPRFLANINPNNPNSIRLFNRLGFRHIQNTYEFMGQTKRRRK